MGEQESCPWCKRKFEVARYGRRIPCPRCRKPIDIFPEPEFFLHTPVGVIGVSYGKKLPPSTSAVVRMLQRVQRLISD